MKNILIIGGSYGIGFSIAKEIQNSHNVYVASRTENNLSELNVTHIPFDVMKETLNCSELPDVIDGFVYCPGSINLRPFKGIKPESFEEDYQINFLGIIKVIQTILPRLNASNQASIVLFSSVAATIGMPFHTSIAASKGAVEGFTKAFAAEYAPKFRVNAIAPSLTATPLADKFLNTESKQEKAAERNPMKRYGTAEDMAKIALFLLSDASSWMTGQIIHVDGGMSSIVTN